LVITGKAVAVRVAEREDVAGRGNKVRAIGPDELGVLVGAHCAGIEMAVLGLGVLRAGDDSNRRQ
jgi:hypothetical protein